MGHRNAQGAALHPATGALWRSSTARGGDEINIPEAGKNLRLAGYHLRRRLFRRQDWRGHGEGGDGAADLLLGPVDRGDFSVDITPREYVLDYLAHSFPTQLYEPFTDSEGNLSSRPV